MTDRHQSQRRPRQVTADGVQTADTDRGSGARILIADEKPGVTTIVSDVLASAGFQVLCAGGGAEAVELARAELPDLILLDVTILDTAVGARSERPADVLHPPPASDAYSRCPPPPRRDCRRCGGDASPNHDLRTRLDSAAPRCDRRVRVPRRAGHRLHGSGIMREVASPRQKHDRRRAMGRLIRRREKHLENSYHENSYHSRSENGK